MQGGMVRELSLPCEAVFGTGRDGRWFIVRGEAAVGGSGGAKLRLWTRDCAGGFTGCERGEFWW